MAARIAMLHHLVTHVSARTDDLSDVGPESIRAGATLCHWFAYEAERIYALFAESATDKAARELIDYIRARGGRITARGVMRSNNRKYPTSEKAESALAALVKAGLGRWEEPDTQATGGHRVRAFVLCMTHDTHDTRPWPDEGALHDTVHDTRSVDPQKPEENEASVMRVMRHADPDGEKSPADPHKASVMQTEQVSCRPKQDELEF
jgi:hypothetical protein